MDADSYSHCFCSVTEIEKKKNLFRLKISELILDLTKILHVFIKYTKFQNNMNLASQFVMSPQTQCKFDGVHALTYN